MQIYIFRFKNCIINNDHEDLKKWLYEYMPHPSMNAEGEVVKPHHAFTQTALFGKTLRGALQKAALLGHTQCMEYLFEAGVYMKTDHVIAALYYTAEAGQMTGLQFLLDHFPKAVLNDTILQVAVNGGGLTSVSYIFENCRPRLDQIQIMFNEAIVSQSDVVFAYLIKVVNEMADNQLKEEIFESAVVCACQKASNEYLVHLLQNGASVQNDYFAIYNAIPTGNIDTIKILLDFGAAIPGRNEYSALHRTAFIPLIIRSMDWNGDEQGADIAELLIERGVDVDMVDRDHDTTLILAARNNRPLLMKQLLKSGANVNHIGESGKTALYHAAEATKFNMVCMLLHAGADPNISNLMLVCPLRAAVQFSRPGQSVLKVVKELIKYGALVNHHPIADKPSVFEDTLSVALQNGYNGVVECLILAGGDPSVFRAVLGKTDIRISHKISKHLIDIGSNPLSMKGMVRCVIRSHFTFQQLDDMQQLPLPTYLKQYLNFCDMSEISA